MISVPIDRIVPLTDARDNFSRLVVDVENISDGLYVLTKGGKPAIALINIKYLEEIMEGRGSELGHEHSRQTSVTHHTAPKPHTIPKPEDTKPAPTILHDLPKPPTVKPPVPNKPNFEVPRIPTAPISSPPPVVSKPQSNYDVKPSINPTWTGEDLKADSTISSTPLTSQSQSSLPPLLRSDTVTPDAIINKPFEADKAPNVSAPLPSQNDKPVLPPPVPSKPPVNPWPIIPPRSAISKDTSTTAVPPRPTISTPPPSSTTDSVGVNQSSSAPLPPPPLPEAPAATYPKMVAPPPPPPPSPLPRIPSSFQTVPVPVNGSKPPVTAPVTLPPPPVTTAPAPFANTSPATTVVTPKAADTIPFDQPPTTIPDPGEDLPVAPAANTAVPAADVPATPAAATPPQSQASVQDLEI